MQPFKLQYFHMKNVNETVIPLFVFLYVFLFPRATRIDFIILQLYLAYMIFTVFFIIILFQRLHIPQK